MGFEIYFKNRCIRDGVDGWEVDGMDMIMKI